MPSPHARHATSQSSGQGGTLPVCVHATRQTMQDSLTQVGRRITSFPIVLGQSETVEPCAAPQAVRGMGCVSHFPSSLPNHRRPGLRNALHTSRHFDRLRTRQNKQEKKILGLAASGTCRKERLCSPSPRGPRGTRGRGPRSHTLYSACASSPLNCLPARLGLRPCPLVEIARGTTDSGVG